ncbi:epithelial-stromal interaction protein 1 [Hyperolius riggenbachi]|uniref:epithelial-stromal interaction protein 1 n=1 Tax=Hyperolius riggenbachi TaxID=752182 RepID=UPI0035A30463
MAMAHFANILRKNTLPVRCLICDSLTRWNLTLLMFSRLLEQEKATTQYLYNYSRITHSGEMGMFWPKNWTLKRNACRLMRLFEEVTNLLTVATLAVTLYYARRRTIMRRRRWWVHPLLIEREQKGQFALLYYDLRRHPDKFFKYCRMSVALFDQLLAIVRIDLQKSDTQLRKSVTPEEQLLLTLSNGTYVVIPPNQTKREKLLAMATREQEEYNRFLETRKSGPINLAPSRLGGQTSETEVRLQQQRAQAQSKYQKMLQREEQKRREKAEEDAKIQQKKDAQRKKAEKLEEKKRQEDIERRERWHASRQMVNTRFLDQFSQPRDTYPDENSYMNRSSSLAAADVEDEDWILQEVLNQSIQTHTEEEDNRRRRKEEQWMRQQKEEEEERKRQSVAEAQRRQSSRQSYRQQQKEQEDRQLQQQIKEEQCRKQKEEEEERKRQSLAEAQRRQASRQSYRQQQKEQEDRQLQQMKEEQRRKSELLEKKKEEDDRERVLSQQQEQRRVNNAFLDRLQGLSISQHEYHGDSNTWA